MPSTEIVLWEDAERWSREAHRAERERRSKRRFITLAIAGPCFAFGSLLLALTVLDQPPTKAAAEPAPPVTMAPSTTYPTPETIPPVTAPGWTLVRVQLPGWDGQGRLLTDGEHAGRDNRVLPGSVGVSIVAVAADPSLAGTVVVEGVAWRVTERGTVPQNDISRFFRRPVEPVLVLISTLPGTDRAYVEARR
jgi:hypothetical protein